jgi:hypothetical protein
MSISTDTRVANLELELAALKEQFDALSKIVDAAINRAPYIVNKWRGEDIDAEQVTTLPHVIDTREKVRVLKMTNKKVKQANG